LVWEVVVVVVVDMIDNMMVVVAPCLGIVAGRNWVVAAVVATTTENQDYCKVTMPTVED
jgi:methylthioribose-1-phosphate isomerase